MNFIESRFLGIQIDESGHQAVLSFVDAKGAKFFLEMIGVERIYLTDVRQQNVVEDIAHWTRDSISDGLRAASFYLMTGSEEKDCSDALSEVALGVMKRVSDGDIEMIEIQAIYGAQLVATFQGMSIKFLAE